MLRSPFVFVSHAIIQSVFFVFFPSFLLCNPPLPKPFFLFLLPFLTVFSLFFFLLSISTHPLCLLLSFQYSFSSLSTLQISYAWPPSTPEFLSFPQSRSKIPEANTKCCLSIWCFFLFLSLCCHPNKLCITSKCTFGNSYKTHIWYPLFVLLQSLISHNITKCHDVTGRAEQWMW